jgi:hypothetical protein
LKWEKTAEAPMQGHFGLVGKRRSGNEAGKPVSDHFKGAKL